MTIGCKDVRPVIDAVRTACKEINKLIDEQIKEDSSLLTLTGRILLDVRLELYQASDRLANLHSMLD